ncbi:sterile alpha motif (SAM) domain-containing protein [Actinidia rufa]|uniref:Sterile alpha motif (SAM) domain-containing protein n=1 Tax=Actinidia rufa TaxID=165716 RepID=A0A7J0EYP2_9ERIC|nr:sterile alpha motif (SAM) domain-containing protein [Actinidia rufa]
MAPTASDSCAPPVERRLEKTEQRNPTQSFRTTQPISPSYAHFTPNPHHVSRMAELHPQECPSDAATAATTSAAAAITTAVLPASARSATNRRPFPTILTPVDPSHGGSYKDPGLAAKSSKTRPLTNLVNGGPDCHETLETEENLDFGNRKPKSKRPATKRVRTNWAVSTKVDNGVEGDSREDNNENFRDFEPEGSDSPLQEQSPLQSIDNVALDFWHGNRRSGRARVSESRDREQDDGLPESNSRDRKCGTSRERNCGSGSEMGRDRFLDDGVRNWLIGLGLGRYAPVFEIHEVDDEVLPMLTLEDLKDMGINAVGSRRKLYTAIQKLGKGFS